MSQMRPHSNLVLRRSSRVAISFGGLSDEMTICLVAWWSASEGVEELFLGSVLSGHKLNIVY